MKIGIIDQAKYGNLNPKKLGSTFLRSRGLIENDKDFVVWEEGMKCDAYIFQKVHWEVMMGSIKEPKILDLCDPTYFSLKQRGGFDLIASSKLVNAITCSSPALTESVRKYVKDKIVEYVPDRLNFKIFPNPRVHTERATSVAWFGYSQNADQVLPDVIPSLAKSNLKLYVISNKPYTPIDNFGVDIENIVYDSDMAYYDIQRADMVLNPKCVTNTQFKYKSNNKTIISWKLGLPVAETGDDMRKFMDPKERTKEVEVRMKEVDRDYNIIKSGLEYKQIIKQINVSRK